MVFAAAAAVFVLAAGSMTAQDPRTPFLYVGGYRPEISIFRLDTKQGLLTPAGTAVGVGQNPSFLAWDPRARFLFAIDELDPGRVRSFSIDQSTGALSPINDMPAMGSITAHVSTDRTGRWLLVANYGDEKQGTVASFPIDAGGRIGPAVSSREFGLGSMAHYIGTDPANRFAFVPLKGGPAVAQLVFDPATGQLTPNIPARVTAADGAGPRHLDFHPSGRLAYVINELALTMTAYAYDAKGGTLHEMQVISTLPAAADKAGASGADVHVHRSGRFVYGSNRGHNSIAIFRLAEDGRMTLVGHEARHIRRPRNFTIDPTGTLLIVANQDSASVVVFRIDQERGTLEPLGPPVPAGQNPSFVGVAMLGAEK